MDRIVNVGIIGCGGIAGGKHMPSLKKLPNVRMVAFCDIIPEKAEKAAKEFEALVKQAEKYEDLTAEETMELAAVQAKYAGLQAKKGINKVIDGVKDLFGGKKDK